MQSCSGQRTIRRAQQGRRVRGTARQSPGRQRVRPGLLFARHGILLRGGDPLSSSAGGGVEFQKGPCGRIAVALSIRARAPTTAPCYPPPRSHPPGRVLRPVPGPLRAHSAGRGADAGRAMHNMTAMERSILAELSEHGGRGRINGLTDRRPLERLINKGLVERHTLNLSEEEYVLARLGCHSEIPLELVASLAPSPRH